MPKSLTPGVVAKRTALVSVALTLALANPAFAQTKVRDFLPPTHRVCYRDPIFISPAMWAAPT
jgi:hypothetical protein